jgi:hypothetical protein
MFVGIFADSTYHHLSEHNNQPNSTWIPQQSKVPTLFRHVAKSCCIQQPPVKQAEFDRKKTRVLYSLREKRPTAAAAAQPEMTRYRIT